MIRQYIYNINQQVFDGKLLEYYCYLVVWFDCLGMFGAS